MCDTSIRQLWLDKILFKNAKNAHQMARVNSRAISHTHTRAHGLTNGSSCYSSLKCTCRSTNVSNRILLAKSMGTYGAMHAPPYHCQRNCTVTTRRETSWKLSRWVVTSWRNIQYTSLSTDRMYKARRNLQGHLYRQTARRRRRDRLSDPKGIEHYTRISHIIQLFSLINLLSFHSH